MEEWSVIEIRKEKRREKGKNGVYAKLGEGDWCEMFRKSKNEGSISECLKWEVGLRIWWERCQIMIKV